MSLRTSLKSLIGRDPTAPSLSDRLAAGRAKIADVKKRARVAAKMGHVAFHAQKPEPAPVPVDRLALINYATWLANERRLLCLELYPQDGYRAHRFIHANVAAEEFHRPAQAQSWRDVPLPSTRAVDVLEWLGVDWRTDEPDRDEIDPPTVRRTLPDIEPPVGWPQVDGNLLTALVDLRRVDAAIEALLAHLPSDRHSETVPGYEELTGARLAVLDILTDSRADSLSGLQAKAKTLLTDSVRSDSVTIAAMAHSIAKDLIGASPSILAPQPDPVRAVIAEGRRLLQASRDAYAIPDIGFDPDPAREEAQEAVWAHFRGPLLQTVPTTARGCAELARFVAEFREFQDVDLGDELMPILALIARSPLL